VARYFSTNIEVPTGSTDFTKPEKIKVPPIINDRRMVAICRTLALML
jgi:hypothetical protein